MTAYTLHEAIVLAHDVYKQIGQPAPYVSVDPILRYAERVEGARTERSHQISAVTAQITKEECRGFWVRGPDSSTIYVSHQLNFCWQRFVACKEATHLLVDDDQRFASSAQDQTEEAFELFWPRQARADLTSEVFAAVVAFEVLYPWAAFERAADPIDFDRAKASAEPR